MLFPRVKLKVSTIYSQATTRRSRSPTTEPAPAGGISMANNEGLYHLDANLDDSSGNGRNGTATGGVTQVAGRVGTYAREVDTTGQIAFTTDFQFTSQDFSVATLDQARRIPAYRRHSLPEN